MSALSAPTASNSTGSGSLIKRRNSEEEDIQRKRPATPSQQQTIDRRFSKDVREQDMEVGDGGSPAIVNAGDRDAQRGELKGGADSVFVMPTDALTVTTETPSISMFPGASNFQVRDSDIITVSGDAMFIQLGVDGQFTEVQRNLIGDYIAKHIVLPAINEKSKKHVLTQLIILLPRAEAVFDDYQTKKKSGPCFEGTRIALLKEMADWVTSQDEVRMYILSGLAGIGKSTVAYTIASRAADLNLLGASFFFSRDEGDRNNAKKLFTTIAYQLCVYDERFSNAIGDALLTERGSAAITKDPLEQLQALILDPLRSIVQSRVRPILVIVDALDECCEADVPSVIQGLGLLVQTLLSFKVILTTRPPYTDYFVGNQGGHNLFHLQDIEDKIVDDDIRLYLRYNLSLERVRAQMPRRQWFASDKDIDFLVHTAGRLFIIASTSVRYILDKSISNPAAQMKKLLGASSQDHTPFKDLGCFYTVILRNVVPDNRDNEIVIRYQSVLGAIIFIRYPLPVSALCHLIDVDVEEIYAVLDNLQSVILLGDNDVPRIYHKSFPDFVTDQAHGMDSYLQIDPMMCHTQLTKHCFQIMNKHLKYNILNLGTPARFMNNKDGLEKDKITDGQLEEKVPTQLRYACVYWAAHLELANIEDGEIVNRLDKFMNEHMLHWFEVLSLIGNLDSAHRVIRGVLKLQKSTSLELHQLLSDALRFISKFYEVINRSALHTYYSALPFSPTDSFLYRRYIKEVKDSVCHIENGPQKWDALIADLSHGELVHDIKFSLNSTLVVSCSETTVNESTDHVHQGCLKIWDAMTGTPISTFPGDLFAVSNDSFTFASLKGNIITHHNHDGSATGTIVTTSSKIQALALSSESNRIAAAFSDETVCLWDSRNGELIDDFKGTGYQQGLRFSPSGMRLVYTQVNGIIKLRHGISGRLVADLSCGSGNQKIEFSANGSRLVSRTYIGGLRLWNTESGELIGAVQQRTNAHFDGALAISANGSLLATADHHASAYGNGVVLWSENCDQLTKMEVLQANHVYSIAFSPDDTLAICDYESIKIHNIKTRSMSTLLPIKSRGPLTFSPDGTRLACRTLLCDVQAINDSYSPSRILCAIALSRDCSRLASRFQDGTLELWGIQPNPVMIMRHSSSYGRFWYGLVGMVFGPDSRLLAFWLTGTGIIDLWNSGDGTLFGTLRDVRVFNVTSVTLSNSILVAGDSFRVTLWDLNTLRCVHAFTTDDRVDQVSISDEGDLAIIFNSSSIHLFDLENLTTTCICTRKLWDYGTELTKGLTVTLLPDKSHFVVQSPVDGGKFLSFNLVNKSTMSGPILEHLIQLPNTLLWRGVPLWHCFQRRSWPDVQHYIAALFSQDESPVPVLWIPSDIPVKKWSQGLSMIALGCEDGRIILLRL